MKVVRQVSVDAAMVRVEVEDETISANSDAKEIKNLLAVLNMAVEDVGEVKYVTTRGQHG